MPETWKHTSQKEEAKKSSPPPVVVVKQAYKHLSRSIKKKHLKQEKNLTNHRIWNAENRSSRTWDAKVQNQTLITLANELILQHRTLHALQPVPHPHHECLISGRNQWTQNESWKEGSYRRIVKVLGGQNEAFQMHASTAWASNTKTSSRPGITRAAAANVEKG